MENNNMTYELMPSRRPGMTRRRLRCGRVLPSVDPDPAARNGGAASGPWENEPDRGDLLAAVDESADRLHRQVERHRTLVAAALKACLDPDVLDAIKANCPRRSREKRYKTAIQGAIEVLDASRRAFKSKQLEALRKHLTQVLIDTR